MTMQGMHTIVGRMENEMFLPVDKAKVLSLKITCLKMS